MCNEKTKTRLLAILLVFCMLAASMPMLAYAAEGDEADPMQQVTEEEQSEPETQPPQEPAESAAETLTDIAEEAVAEAAEEPETGQEAEPEETTDKPASPPLRAPAADPAEPAEDDDDGTGIETDEHTDLPEGGQEVKFIFDGADKLDAWIEGVSESAFSMDPDRKFRSEQVIDEVKKTYSKYYYDNGKLVGTILIGDISGMSAAIRKMK